jgi:hypothetical protein
MMILAVLRIRDVYPGSRILIFIHPGSRIPDPTITPKEGGGWGEFFCCPTIFCSHKYHKIVNNFILELVKKFFLAKTLRIIIFTQKFVRIRHTGFWVLSLTVP